MAHPTIAGVECNNTMDLVFSFSQPLTPGQALENFACLQMFCVETGWVSPKSVGDPASVGPNDIWLGYGGNIDFSHSPNWRVIAGPAAVRFSHDHLLPGASGDAHNNT